MGCDPWCHGLVDVLVSSHRVESMIWEVFSYLIDSAILHSKDSGKPRPTCPPSPPPSPPPFAAVLPPKRVAARGRPGPVTWPRGGARGVASREARRPRPLPAPALGAAGGRRAVRARARRALPRVSISSARDPPSLERGIV